MGVLDISLLSFNSGTEFAQHVAALNVPLGAHEEREFRESEHKIHPIESVRNRGVFVIQAIHDGSGWSVNGKLCRLLFFTSVFKDTAAARLAAVAPYLGYARKDRRTQSRDPLATRYVARMFEDAGTDRVVTVDVHNLAAFRNAFSCQTENLGTRGTFVRHYVWRVGKHEVSVYSPDVGG